jgi:site-specific recombinase XerD
MEAISGLNNRYFTVMTERMSVNNAYILAKFIISDRKERNIASNTIMLYIDGIAYLGNYLEHKELDKMDKNDIISFLDSYRKPETTDPLHKWITYIQYTIRYNLQIFQMVIWFEV